jgi:diguanylate cyclase (GGDEF)-like protein
MNERVSAAGACAARLPLALVVDDDATMRLLAREVLEQNGFRVIEAQDGAAGLAVFAEERPELVLLDVQMPRKDGFATCSELRTLPEGQHVPVLMMTGLNDVESIDRAYRSGATDFITKPISWPILGHRARYMLRTGRTYDELKRQEEKLAKGSRIRTVLSGINAALMRVQDRAKLFEEACRIAVEHGRFRMAWIGLIEQDKPYAKPEAWAGHVAGYLDDIGTERRRTDSAGAGKLVLQSGTALVVNRIATDSRVLYKTEALARGYASLVILPLQVENRTAGLFTLYAAEEDFFTEEEMRLLNELCGDVSFGLDYLAKRERLDYLAYYDALTGLPNRSLFCDRVNQQVNAARQDSRILSVIHFEIDRLRSVNDTLGNAAGDALLRMVAGRLGNAIAEPDLVARVSANSFAVALVGMKSEADAVHILERAVMSIFTSPFTVAGTELRASARAGIALFPNDGADADALLANAGTALKKAKAAGEPYLFYTAQMNARVAGKLFLENKLARALEKGQFDLHYQPKIDLASGRIRGLEGLLRWNDAESGPVPPIVFVPLLEETGLILNVGKWVIRKALEDHRRWAAAGLEPPRVAVNVSPLQLRHRDFVNVVREALADCGSGAHGLDLEITESLIMDDIEQNIPKLAQLRDMKVSLAIDDFGTGYSSLSYVSKLPVDVLKIDRAFIVDMTESHENREIVSVIIALAHSLRLKVVAEGVETEQQAGLLRSLGCDQMQGHLFSEALPAAGIEALLARDLGARAA